MILPSSMGNSWLQTDYGIDFGRFLLEHFKIKALIDISVRVPLIGTCIILFEKCTNLKRKSIPLSELFEPSRENYFWAVWSIKHGKRPDAGAKDFFYLDDNKVQQYNLRNYAYPALTSARYAKWFTFTRQDWENLKKKGSLHPQIYY